MPLRTRRAPPLEELGRQQNAHAAPAPRRAEPPPAARPEAGGAGQGRPPDPAAVADSRSGIDGQARAAAVPGGGERAPGPGGGRQGRCPLGVGAELRGLGERSRAARAIVEQRHQSLVEANGLLTDARRVLAPIAYRGISDRIYRRRKVILAIGEAVSLGVAFSAAFDVAPLEALLLSGAIALAFVIAGDLGGVLRLTAERSRLSAAVEDGVMQLDPRYLHILYYDRQPWLSIVGGVTAGIFAVAAVSVGVLRAANQGSLGLASGLALLTVSLAIAAGLSSWQHASIGSEIIDHLQREEEAAARRLKRAAAARVLRSPPILGAVRSDEWRCRRRRPTWTGRRADMDCGGADRRDARSGPRGPGEACPAAGGRSRRRRSGSRARGAWSGRPRPRAPWHWPACPANSADRRTTVPPLPGRIKRKRPRSTPTRTMSVLGRPGGGRRDPGPIRTSPSRHRSGPKKFP